MIVICIKQHLSNIWGSINEKVKQRWGCVEKSTADILNLNLNLDTLREKCSYSELFWSAFPRIRTEYREILRVSPYSVRMRENADENNNKYGHFLRSERSARWIKGSIRKLALRVNWPPCASNIETFPGVFGTKYSGISYILFVQTIFSIGIHPCGPGTRWEFHRFTKRSTAFLIIWSLIPR